MFVLLWLVNSIDHYYLTVAFIALRLYTFFPDIVLLYVTDRNGTEIASTQVVLYKCGAATKYVLFLLINMVVICFCIGVMGERVAKVVDR